MSYSHSEVETARNHVERGQVLIASQEARVQKLKDAGQECATSQALLETFRQTQVLFEFDLAHLLTKQRPVLA